LTLGFLGFVHGTILDFSFYRVATQPRFHPYSHAYRCICIHIHIHVYTLCVHIRISTLTHIYYIVFRHVFIRTYMPPDTHTHILLHLNTYKAPFVGWTVQRRSQWSGPGEEK